MSTETTNMLQYLSETSQSLSKYMKEKRPEQLWMVDLQRAYFQLLAEAKDNGRPLILIGPNIPPELVFALGGAPMMLDCFPTRLASEGDMVAKYIDIANQHVPDTLCGLNRAGLGLILSGDLGVPDAMIYTTTPCDSGRAVYSAVNDYLDIPSFCIDTPFKKDDRGYSYIGKEIQDGVSFLEDVMGTKMDREKLLEVIDYSNEAYDLLAKCADLRKHSPCPLPSRFLVLNEFFGAMVGTPEIIDFLRTEYEFGKSQIEKGRGVTKGEEKYRIMWLQNMPWFSVSILDWLEKEYDAVVTMDAFGYLNEWQITDTSSDEAIYKGFASRILGMPMTHGSSGPVEYNMDIVDIGVTEYNSNLAFFSGHVGCKHTWAAAKLLKDMAYDKYGVRTFTFDLDCVDVRYKGVEEIKAEISEFMSTID